MSSFILWSGTSVVLPRFIANFAREVLTPWWCITVKIVCSCNGVEVRLLSNKGCVKVVCSSEKMHSRLNCQPTIMPVSPKKIQAASSVELTLCMQFGGNDKWCRKCGPESTEVRLWWQESGKRRKWETIVKHVLHLTQDWWLKLKAALGIKWMNRASQHKHHKVLLFNNLWKYAYRHNFDNSSACCFIFSVFTFHNKSPRHRRCIAAYQWELKVSILLKVDSAKYCDRK